MNVTIASPSNIVKAVPYSLSTKLRDLDVEDTQIAPSNLQPGSIQEWISGYC